jgi:hypothetical protein
MKMVRELVDAIVLFEKCSVNPMIITYSLGNMKINRVIKSWKERRNLRDCCIYLCQAEGRTEPIELRWEIDSNRWFIEKI